MQQRRGTAAQWTSANPVLNAGEMGWESDTNKFKIGDGTNHWADLDYFADINSTVNPAFGSSITFEGATADSYETVLQVTDPTADRTITLPNASGTVITTGNLSDITDIGVFTSTITMEGSTADAYELTISAGDPTADRTATFPNATGTIVLDSATQTLTNKTLTTPVISSITNGAATLTLPTSTGTIALTTDIPAGVVTTSDSGTVTSTMIANGTITNDDINASAAIAQSKISDLTTDLAAKLALAGGTMTGAIAMGTNKITGLGTPTADADAATKAYVDAATAGLNVHAAVQAATTANVTLASVLENGDTLDGVTLATGNRVLVKNQTDKTENGVYVVKASGAPDRATDYDSTPEVDAGDFIFVEAGTVNGKTGWTQTNVITTIGSDNIEFTQFSGAGTYSAGTGLTLTGTTFSINTATTADLSTAQTLTNKTLTSPVISTITNTGTLTLPTSTDTLVGRATTDTLTNKTLSSAVATTALTLNATAELRLADTDSSHYVGFKAPATVSTNRIWTLPSADGTTGQFLSTNGSGALSWTSPSSGGAAFSEFMLIGA